MLILGLTGSMAMGKSTTANLFRQAGVAVFDADAAVHRLYAGDAAAAIEQAFPGTTTNGVVDRARLREHVLREKDGLLRLERIVHPLVRKRRDAFLSKAAAGGEERVVLDIPLLFETHADAAVDCTIVVSAPESVQKARIMTRSDMTDAQFAAILAKQLPDSEKRRRAHFVIDSSRGLDSAHAQVLAVLRAVAAVPGGVFKGPRLENRKADARDRPRH